MCDRARRSEGDRKENERKEGERSGKHGRGEVQGRRARGSTARGGEHAGTESSGRGKARECRQRREKLERGAAKGADTSRTISAESPIKARTVLGFSRSTRLNRALSVRLVADRATPTPTGPRPPPTEPRCPEGLPSPKRSGVVSSARSAGGDFSRIDPRGNPHPEDIRRLTQVVIHLGEQIFKRVESQHRPDPRHEDHSDPLTVQVEV